MTDDREIARRALDWGKRARNFRVVDLPGYDDWRRKKVAEGEPAENLERVDESCIFLLPEEASKVTEDDFEEFLADARAESEAFDEDAMQPMNAAGSLRAAERGSPAHQASVASSYLSGIDWDGNPIPVDLERAKHWLEEAARTGLPSALYLLGTMFEEGLGMAPNIERAMRLYEKGADQRAFLPSIQSCIRLARIHSKAGTERHSPEEARCRYQAVLEIAAKYRIEAEATAEIEEAKNYLGLAR